MACTRPPPKLNLLFAVGRRWWALVRTWNWLGRPPPWRLCTASGQPPPSGPEPTPPHSPPPPPPPTAVLRNRLTALGLQPGAEVAAAGADFAFVPTPALPPEACVVKSLLFEYSAPPAAADPPTAVAHPALPVVVVLELRSRVCEKLLAAALQSQQPGQSGRLVARLMAQDRAQQHAGFTRSNIPALGHRTPTPVVVDQALVAARAADGLYCGAGADGWEMWLRLQALLDQPGTTVARVSVRGGPGRAKAPPSGTAAGESPSPAPSCGQRTGPSPTAIRKAAGDGDGYARLRQLLLARLRADGLPETLPDPRLGPVLNHPSPGSGRTALHEAAWRGPLVSVALLLNCGAALDQHGTGPHNYGKTPLFFALTRGRDAVVALLVARGAGVLIVNNKGQTPRSLAATHCAPATQALLAAAEARQRAAGLAWRNFRATHSDGLAYGDLDARFGLDEANGFPSSGADPGAPGASSAEEGDAGVSEFRVVRATTAQSRHTAFQQLNGIPVPPASGPNGPPKAHPPPPPHAPRPCDPPDAVPQARPYRYVPTAPAAGPPPLPHIDVPTGLWHLVGTLATKRRLAKRLAFFNLVPPADPDVPGVAPWDPGSPQDPFVWASAREPADARVAVQLIVGQTLQARVGPQAVADTIRRLRPGQLVHVVGRPAPSPRPGPALGDRITYDVKVSHITVLEAPQAPCGTQAPGPPSGRADSQATDVPRAPPSASDPPLLPVLDFADVRAFAAAVGGASPPAPAVQLVHSAADVRERLEPWLAAARAAQGLCAGAIGVDCEWEPGRRHAPVALLQLACGGRACVVDLQALCRPHAAPGSPLTASEAVLDAALQGLFQNPQGHVLGFGLAGDLRRLAASFPQMPCFRHCAGVVDLTVLAPCVLTSWSRRSLASLCQTALGRGLDKSLQCSPWHVRPLTEAQVAYAALDALVLPMVLRVLARRVCRCGTAECSRACVLDAFPQAVKDWHAA